MIIEDIINLGIEFDEFEFDIDKSLLGINTKDVEFTSSISKIFEALSNMEILFKYKELNILPTIADFSSNINDISVIHFIKYLKEKFF